MTCVDFFKWYVNAELVADPVEQHRDPQRVEDARLHQWRVRGERLLDARSSAKRLRRNALDQALPLHELPGHERRQRRPVLLLRHFAPSSSVRPAAASSSSSDIWSTSA